ncbi:uncharacterized protein PV06_10638 [Exophiala oligosperma]|uniref:BHLH domain-containing protein n=1 Tax=Exophiala oligosperma TaxID=215243 RepID=A0A0D2D1W1_9EURO|nr:uncharacterized protein PV06_10638 [Exophiala oligosperma]KIW37298.1 hypothetical protein PV06_10638 [Exophiala oligosperma]
MSQQSSYDDDIFLQRNNDNDNYPDLTYFDEWPIQGGPQDLQFANYSTTKSPFVNPVYFDSVENTVPVSFIVPSQTLLVSSPQLSTGPVNTRMLIEYEQSQPPITPGTKKSGKKSSMVTRFAASPNNLRIDAREGPGLAPGVPASQSSAGAIAQAHLGTGDQVPLIETKPEKKRGRSDSSEDEDSASLRAKHNHTMIERRYRDNLNGKINQLHRILQATEANSPLMLFDAEISDHGRRVRKSDIMARAIQYVNRSELEGRHKRDEIQRLREKVQNLERLGKCGDCTLLQNMRRIDFSKGSC